MPNLYDILSYEKIMELKEQINYTLSNHKTQDNKVFKKEAVKSKLILLNYLVDMEDLLLNWKYKYKIKTKSWNKVYFKYNYLYTYRRIRWNT